jgi:hypothetical protein
VSTLLVTVSINRRVSTYGVPIAPPEKEKRRGSASESKRIQGFHLRPDIGNPSAGARWPGNDVNA